MNKGFSSWAPISALVFAAVALPSGAARADGPTKQQCVTANESAQDLARSGRLIEARAALALCLSASCPRLIRSDCEHRLADVESAMPSLVFEATDTLGNDLTEVHVAIDGKPLLDKLQGVATPVDPGSHVISYQAPGFPTTTKTIVIAEGDKARHVKVMLGSAPSPPPPPTHAEHPAPPAHEDDGRTQRDAGLALGAVGVVGLAVGGVFGLLAKSTYDTALAVPGCKGTLCTNPQAVSDYHDALTQATISDVSFAAGGALLAVGAVVFFTAPKDNGLTIGWAPDRRGGLLTARGRW
ncbi:MAG: hypothetical protein ABSC94_26310 [Polyangiaceae bacterium]|jgi:hypothetical protein